MAPTIDLPRDQSGRLRATSDDSGSVDEPSTGSHSPRARTMKALAMRWLGLVIGALVMLASAITFVAPDLRLSLERSVMTPAGLYAIAALRIAIGLVFVLAAPASRAPRTLRVLGLIVIIAGLTTPWFGVTRARAVLNWASARPVLMRLDAGVGMAIGGFLVYVFRTPTRRAT
jgi:hypothetical protein